MMSVDPPVPGVFVCAMHFCRMDEMLYTSRQRVAMSVPLGAWPPRWRLCSIALIVKVIPCSTGQLRKAKLKWYSSHLKNTMWTSLLLTRFVFDGILNCVSNKAWMRVWDEIRECESGCTVLSLMI